MPRSRSPGCRDTRGILGLVAGLQRRRRVDPVYRSTLTRWSRLTVPIAIAGLVVAACSGGGATTAPTAGGSSSAGAAPSGTVHVPIVNKDMSPDDIKAAITERRQPGRRQLDLHRQRRAGQRIPGLRQEDLRRRRQARLRGQPGAERVPDGARTRPRRAATRRRTTSWPSRRTTGPRRWPRTCRRQLPAVRASSRTRRCVLDQFQHVPTVDRVPVDRLPGDRLQQGDAPRSSSRSRTSPTRRSRAR